MDRLHELFFPGPVLVRDQPGTTVAAAVPQRVKALYSTLANADEGDVSTTTSSDDEGDGNDGEGQSVSEFRSSRHYLNPYAPQNAAITLGFINTGLASYFLYAPVSVYLINDLDASSAQYSAFAALASLPWCLKFLFGIISDTSPIFGYRRKSWVIIGWVFYIVFCLYMSYQDEPSILLTTFVFFLSTCCYLLSDVCTDTLCVERARVFESALTKGTLQTSGYTSRAFGSIVGAVLGAVLYNVVQWGWGLTISQLWWLAALIPIFPLLPSLWFLIEIRSVSAAAAASVGGLEGGKKAAGGSVAAFVPPTLREQVQSIWHTLQLRAVYMPIGYLFFFYLLQIPNSAWSNFLLVGLKFTDYQVGLLSVGECVFTYLGMVTFKLCFFRTPWRRVFVYTCFISICFSILQVLLILRVNQVLGIPDFFFALGDTSAVEFVYAIQSMPSNIMLVMLCPEGSEGVTYALLTTIGNLAWTVAQVLGGAFTLVWDVRNETLAAGDYTGLLKLTLFTSLVQVLPILWVRVLPASRAEHEALIRRGEKSVLGGALLASVIVLGLGATVVVNIYFILFL